MRCRSTSPLNPTRCSRPPPRGRVIDLGLFPKKFIAEIKARHRLVRLATNFGGAAGRHQRVASQFVFSVR
jgi:hypothetical protein